MVEYAPKGNEKRPKHARIPPRDEHAKAGRKGEYKGEYPLEKRPPRSRKR